MQFDLAVSNELKSTEFSKGFRQAAADRGNCPTGAWEDVGYPEHPEVSSRLWIVDRILSPQTFPHFLSVLGHGRLPGGNLTTIPLPAEEEVMLLLQPYSNWATAPYSSMAETPIDNCMKFVGSDEVPRQLVPITKELHSIKSRIWEGLPPLSKRRWEDLDLDNPDNFRAACKYLAMTTDAFNYLNIPVIKSAMRDTHNSIYDELETFEKAINARRSVSGGQPLRLAALWYEFFNAHCSFIASRAHCWVIENIDRLRDGVLERMENLPPGSDDEWLGGAFLELADNIYDLTQNAAAADIGIYIPMDGYRGSGVESADSWEPNDSDKAPYREYPIESHPSVQKRTADYHARLKYLTRVETWRGRESQNPAFGPGGMNATDPSTFAIGVVGQCRSQGQAQKSTRSEMRGSMKLPDTIGREMWIDELRQHISSGQLRTSFLVYRTCFDHSDDQWKLFKAKFEADVNDWGRDLEAIDDIKNLFKVQWVDARDTAESPIDIDGAKSKFRELVQSGAIPNGFHDGFFLAADKSSVDSYLNPGANQSGFIVAVDNNFDREDTSGYRMDETPGYDGQVRILGSLLWDDVSAQISRQSQYLEDIWPLAMQHDLQVYEGPWIKEKLKPSQ
ncbi:unnamed protein product [Clonostachys rhizophaga]|uniref:Uncharacterized protein n=1 Tax=Clonostachys rhizophaga TaxID=160324 RepID=A0A9N9W2A4_9HYPO|nr:unnamed protein product [Clonostachys rhizophaga]